MILPDDATAYVESWLAQPNTTVLVPTSRHWSLLRSLLEATRLGADLTTDAHIAALAIEHGYLVCTNDSDFGRFPSLRWETGAGRVPAPSAKGLQLARKYVWWKPPAEALADLPHFLAHLMTYGTLEDVRWMLATYDRRALLAALDQAPPGVFNGRSWHFWHRRLGRTDVPPLPRRRVAS